MPFVSITVEGESQRIQALNTINQDLPKLVTQSLNEIGDQFVMELKNNVHVWEKRKFGPHMRDVIKRYPVNGNYVDVVVPTRYARRENERRGVKLSEGTPHNFADRAKMTMDSRAPQIIKMQFDSFFSSL